MAKKILIVDDEQDIREILSFNLENEGWHVETASSAEEALRKITPNHSLILLDVMMGGMSGYRLAERLRKGGNTTPIIFLTAKDTENDMLTGFSVGGDDYISKPFSLKEVSVRVRAVLKRSEVIKVKTADNKLAIGDFAMNFLSKGLSINGVDVLLTRTEFEILSLLASKPNCPFSRWDIINSIWKNSYNTTERNVDVHIARLRKKMGDKAAWISSRPGYGYQFNPEEI